MEKQQTLFGESDTQMLKLGGINRAVKHANRRVNLWSQKAMDFLEEFLEDVDHPFMAEDVRLYAASRGLPAPPSQRAWGGIITRASNLNWIEMVGWAPTKNPRSHGTPATLWQKKARQVK